MHLRPACSARVVSALTLPDEVCCTPGSGEREGNVENHSSQERKRSSFQEKHADSSALKGSDSCISTAASEVPDFDAEFNCGEEDSVSSKDATLWMNTPKTGHRGTQLPALVNETADSSTPPIRPRGISQKPNFVMPDMTGILPAIPTSYQPPEMFGEQISCGVLSFSTIASVPRTPPPSDPPQPPYTTPAQKGRLLPRFPCLGSESPFGRSEVTSPLNTLNFGEPASPRLHFNGVSSLSFGTVRPSTARRVISTPPIACSTPPTTPQPLGLSDGSPSSTFNVIRTPSPRRSARVENLDSDSPSGPPSPAAPLRRRNRETLVKAISSDDKKMVLSVCGDGLTESTSLSPNNAHLCRPFRLCTDEDPNERLTLREFSSRIPEPCLDLVGNVTGGGEGREWILPLLAAATVSTPGVVQALLQVGAVVNGVNEDRRNALHVMSLGQLGPGSYDAALQQFVISAMKKHIKSSAEEQAQEPVIFQPVGSPLSLCAPGDVDMLSSTPSRKVVYRRRRSTFRRLSEFNNSPPTVDASTRAYEGSGHSGPSTRVAGGDDGPGHGRLSANLTALPSSAEGLRGDIVQDTLDFREKELALSAYILVSNGIDFRLQDVYGNTPAVYAQMNGHPQVLKVIFEAEDRLRRASFECLVQHSPVFKRQKRSYKPCGYSPQGGEPSSRSRGGQRLASFTSSSLTNNRSESVEKGSCSGKRSLSRHSSAPKPKLVPARLQQFALDFVLPQQQSVLRSPFAGTLTASLIGTPTRSSTGAVGEPIRCGKLGGAMFPPMDGASPDQYVCAAVLKKDDKEYHDEILFKFGSPPPP